MTHSLPAPASAPLCMLCGHPGAALLWETGDAHYGNVGLFRVLRCGHCGLGFMDPMPSAAELDAFYPKTYFAHQPFAPPGRWRRLLNKWLFSDVSTQDPTFARPGALLDVGCGSGAFLQEMRAAGWSVQGVENNPSAAAFARTQGLDVFHGTLPEANFAEASFDYIRLNHCLEHLLEPGLILDKIRSLLKPEGKLFIGVPNLESTTAKWWGPSWWYLTLPVHPYHYSNRTLPALLARHGFAVERLAYNSNYGGVLGSLQIHLKRRAPGIRAQGWLMRQRLLWVPANWLAKLIDRFGTGDAMEITARVQTN